MLGDVVQTLCLCQTGLAVVVVPRCEQPVFVVPRVQWALIMLHARKRDAFAADAANSSAYVEHTALLAAVIARTF